MIERLIKFFTLVSPNSELCMHPIWGGITNHYHSELSAALRSESEPAVMEAMEHFAIRGGLTGIEGLNYFVNRNSESHEMRRILDSGIDISLPDFCGFKCQGPDGGVPHRFLLYCDIALWILSQRNGSVPNSVLEIGAGIGFLGVIMQRMGCKAYTVIDLPTTAVLIAYFLSKCIGSEQVWLVGEGDDHKDRFVRIYASTQFDGAKSSRYDVACSVNGFPEISQPMQDEYLALISNTMTDGGMFMSVNHEDTVLNQRSVADSIKAHTKLHRVSREVSKIICPFGMFDDRENPGIHKYVDEIYSA